MQEEWRSIVGYENIYEVSNLGNVRSVDRYINQKNSKCDGYKHFYKGKQLKQYKNNSGYMQVQLSYLYKSLPKRVHRLVAEAFIDNPNNYSCVNHKDGNKLNNTVNNLEWCTYSQNNKHARNTGLNKGYKGMTYKKKCKLAIEHIKTNFLYNIGNEKGDIFFEDYDIQELYEILKGSDNNE